MIVIKGHPADIKAYLKELKEQYGGKCKFAMVQTIEEFERKSQNEKQL